MAHTYTYSNESLMRASGITRTADFVSVLNFIHDYNKLGLTPGTYFGNATIISKYGSNPTWLFNAARALSPTGLVPTKDKEKDVAADMKGYADDIISKAETRRNSAEAAWQNPSIDGKSLADIETELNDATTTRSNLRWRSAGVTAGIMALAALLFPPILGTLVSGALASSVVSAFVLGGGGAISFFVHKKFFKDDINDCNTTIKNYRKYRRRIRNARTEMENAQLAYDNLVGNPTLGRTGSLENISDISLAYSNNIQQDIADVELQIQAIQTQMQNDWNNANTATPADGTSGKGEYLARLAEGEGLLTDTANPNSLQHLIDDFNALKAAGETDITKYQALEAKARATETNFNNLHLPDLLVAGNPENLTDKHNAIENAINTSQAEFTSRSLEVSELEIAGIKVGGKNASQAFNDVNTQYGNISATVVGGKVTDRTSVLEHQRDTAIEAEDNYRVELVKAWSGYTNDTTHGLFAKVEVAETDSSTAFAGNPALKTGYEACASNLQSLQSAIELNETKIASGTDSEKTANRALKEANLARADVEIALARAYAMLARETNATNQGTIQGVITNLESIRSSIPGTRTPVQASTDAKTEIAKLNTIEGDRHYNVRQHGANISIKADRIKSLLTSAEAGIDAIVANDDTAWKAIESATPAERATRIGDRATTHTRLTHACETLEDLINAMKREDPTFNTSTMETKLNNAKLQRDKANPEVKVKDATTGKEYTQSELQQEISDLFNATKPNSILDLTNKARNMATNIRSLTGDAYNTEKTKREQLIKNANGLKDQIELAERLIGLCDSKYGTSLAGTYATSLTNARTQRDETFPDKQYNIAGLGVMSEDDVAKEIETRLNALKTKIGEAQTAFNAYNSDYVAGRDTSGTKPAWEAIANTGADSVKKQADELGKILQAYKSAGGTLYRSGADESAVTTEIANAKKETAQVFEIDKSVGLIRPGHLDGLVSTAKSAIGAKTKYSFDEVKADPTKAPARQDLLNEYNKWIPALEGVYNAKIGLGSHPLDPGMPELRAYIDGLKQEVTNGMPSVASSEPKLKLNGVLTEASDARESIKIFYEAITDASKPQSLDKEASAFSAVESASDADREGKNNDRSAIVNELKANAIILEKYLNDYENNGGDMSKLFSELGISDVSPINNAISDAKQMSMPVHVHEKADGSGKVVYRMHEAFDEVDKDFPATFTDKTGASIDPVKYDKLTDEVKQAEAVILELKAIRDEINRTYGDSDSRIATMDGIISNHETTLNNSKLTSERPSGEKTYTIDGASVTESVVLSTIENAYQGIKTDGSLLTTEQQTFEDIKTNQADTGSKGFKDAWANRAVAVRDINEQVATLTKYLEAYINDSGDSSKLPEGKTADELRAIVNDAEERAGDLLDIPSVGYIRKSEIDEKITEVENEINTVISSGYPTYEDVESASGSTYTTLSEQRKQTLEKLEINVNALEQLCYGKAENEEDLNAEPLKSYMEMVEDLRNEILKGTPGERTFVILGEERNRSEVFELIKNSASRIDGLMADEKTYFSNCENVLKNPAHTQEEYNDAINARDGKAEELMAEAGRLEQAIQDFEMAGGSFDDFKATTGTTKDDLVQIIENAKRKSSSALEIGEDILVREGELGDKTEEIRYQLMFDMQEEDSAYQAMKNFKGDESLSAEENNANREAVKAKRAESVEKVKLSLAQYEALLRERDVLGEYISDVENDFIKGVRAQASKTIDLAPEYDFPLERDSEFDGLMQDYITAVEESIDEEGYDIEELRIAGLVLEKYHDFKQTNGDYDENAGLRHPVKETIDNAPEITSLIERINGIVNAKQIELDNQMKVVRGKLDEVRGLTEEARRTAIAELRVENHKLAELYVEAQKNPTLIRDEELVKGAFTLISEAGRECGVDSKERAEAQVQATNEAYINCRAQFDAVGELVRKAREAKTAEEREMALDDLKEANKKLASAYVTFVETNAVDTNISSNVLKRHIPKDLAQAIEDKGLNVATEIEKLFLSRISEAGKERAKDIKAQVVKSIRNEEKKNEMIASLEQCDGLITDVHNKLTAFNTATEEDLPNASKELQEATQQLMDAYIKFHNLNADRNVADGVYKEHLNPSDEDIAEANDNGGVSRQLEREILNVVKEARDAYTIYEKGSEEYRGKKIKLTAPQFTPKQTTDQILREATGIVADANVDSSTQEVSTQEIISKIIKSIKRDLPIALAYTIEDAVTLILMNNNINDLMIKHTTVAEQARTANTEYEREMYAEDAERLNGEIGRTRQLIADRGLEDKRNARESAVGRLRNSANELGELLRGQSRELQDQCNTLLGKVREVLATDIDALAQEQIEKTNSRVQEAMEKAERKRKSRRVLETILGTEPYVDPLIEQANQLLAESEEYRNRTPKQPTFEYSEDASGAIPVKGREISDEEYEKGKSPYTFELDPISVANNLLEQANRTLAQIASQQALLSSMAGVNITVIENNIQVIIGKLASVTADTSRDELEGIFGELEQEKNKVDGAIEAYNKKFTALKNKVSAIRADLEKNHGILNKYGVDITNSISNIEKLEAIISVLDASPSADILLKLEEQVKEVEKNLQDQIKVNKPEDATTKAGDVNIKDTAARCVIEGAMQEFAARDILKGRVSTESSVGTTLLDTMVIKASEIILSETENYTVSRTRNTGVVYQVPELGAIRQECKHKDSDEISGKKLEYLGEALANSADYIIRDRDRRNRLREKKGAEVINDNQRQIALRNAIVRTFNEQVLQASGKSITLTMQGKKYVVNVEGGKLTYAEIRALDKIIEAHMFAESGQKKGASVGTNDENFP